jgi:F0F1-type ATP synthase membrane subunit b/b'
VSASAATFVFETLNFIVLALALGWAFSRPMRKVLAEELAARERAESDANATRAGLERSRIDLDARLSSAAHEVDEILNRGRVEAEKVAARIIAEARERIAAERLGADRESDARRRAELDALLGDVAHATARLLLQLFSAAGEAVDAAFVRAARAELVKLTVVDDPALVIESARPPNEDVRAALQGALGTAFASAEVRVVPELVAGVRVTGRGGLVDASARGLAKYAEVALQVGDMSRG